MFCLRDMREQPDLPEDSPRSGENFNFTPKWPRFIAAYQLPSRWSGNVRLTFSLKNDVRASFQALAWRSNANNPLVVETNR